MPLPSVPNCLLRCKRRFKATFPAAESLGVLLGILGFDLVTEGRANLPKALLATALFAIAVMAWRFWRRR